MKKVKLELEVLTVLADGLTNREIAGRLFIAEKTVGVHVGRIYHKLGVRGRVQATSLFRRARPDRHRSGSQTARSGEAAGSIRLSSCGRQRHSVPPGVRLIKMLAMLGMFTTNLHAVPAPDAAAWHRCG